VPNKSAPICIDLFAGAGGLSEGLRQAGFTSVAAVDFDKNATATYAKNHPETVVLTRDISTLDPDELLRILDGRELDLLAGGPSCQGYSTHGKRDAEDPRNFLFKHYLRIAKALRPKWILIENVQGMLTYNKGYFKNEILSELVQMGYHADAKVLVAADYGVPQLRRRIVFLATRTNSEISFPEPTHSPTGSDGLKRYVTVGETFFDLPKILDRKPATEKYKAKVEPVTEFQQYIRAGVTELTLHNARGLSDQAEAIARHLKEAQGLRSAPLDVLPDRFKKMRTISTGELRRDCTTLYYRLARSQPAYTITCYYRNVASGPFLHPLENRSLSDREAARLMSFPDTYEFCASSIPRQIGNAVPPLMARAVGLHIKQLLARSKKRRTKGVQTELETAKCQFTLA
jgi:DNA (cytosine-5)-methyltransferase 1